MLPSYRKQGWYELWQLSVNAELWRRAVRSSPVIRRSPTRKVRLFTKRQDFSKQNESYVIRARCRIQNFNKLSRHKVSFFVQNRRLPKQSVFSLDFSRAWIYHSGKNLVRTLYIRSFLHDYRLCQQPVLLLLLLLFSAEVRVISAARNWRNRTRFQPGSEITAWLICIYRRK